MRGLAPGMVLGTLLASGLLPQGALALAFALIVFAGATQTWLGRKPQAARTLPGAGGLLAVGLASGLVCGLVAAGGAFLTVPFLLFCGVAMHTAIGTGAALGFPVALVGTGGLLAGGSGIDALPAAALGFVYLPALGARLTHRLPVVTLKRIFALLLYALALKMAVTCA